MSIYDFLLKLASDHWFLVWCSLWLSWVALFLILGVLGIGMQLLIRIIDLIENVSVSFLEIFKRKPAKGQLLGSQNPPAKQTDSPSSLGTNVLPIDKGGWGSIPVTNGGTATITDKDGNVINPDARK